MVKNGIYISRNDSETFIVRSYKNGKLHADKYPAVYFFRSAEKYFVSWFKDGKMHREDGPANIHQDLVYLKEYWYQNGQYHREDGPAIVWRKDKDVNFADWFLEGKRVPNCHSLEDLKRFKLKAFL